MDKKYVYLFKEGNASMRELLGGKGANLAEMTNLGLPIPQGFTVTTEACIKYYEDKETISDEVLNQIFSALKEGIRNQLHRTVRLQLFQCLQACNFSQYTLLPCHTYYSPFLILHIPVTSTVISSAIFSS